MSIRDTLGPARRLSLTDSVRAARRAPTRNDDTSRDIRSGLALACAWETYGCLELAANVAAPWVDPQVVSPDGPWTEMTRYHPQRANRFYEGSHKWHDDRFGVLSAHRFGSDEPTFIELLRANSEVHPEVLAAYEEAEVATVRLLRRHFEQLAKAWHQLRRYSAAFEHGLLFVPASVGRVVSPDDEEIPHSMIVWQTRNDVISGYPGTSIDELVNACEEWGSLALEVAHYVTQSRLRPIEVLEFRDGGLYLGELKDPFPFWVDRDDVSPETLAVLRSDVRFEWIADEHSPQDIDPPEPERG